MFVISLQTRRIEIAGIIRQPHGAWMLQIARNLVDADEGFLTGKRFLLLDLDPLYTTAFRELLRAAGVTPIRLSANSPNLNAYAERFVRSIKSECLSKLVLLGENHLRTAVREYVAHYHTERTTRVSRVGSSSRQPVPRRPAPSCAVSPSAGSCASTTGRRPEHVAGRSGPIVCRRRLGGLLRFYHRQAA
jgi:hypothetical protein